MLPSTQIHPDSTVAKLIRRLRMFRHIRGWRTLANSVLGDKANGHFLIQNGQLLFSGNLESFIDREMYLYGQYEELAIQAFLKRGPSDRRRVMLDIGANVGTHSLVFAQHFKHVHAFEPNPLLWENFTRNLALNQIQNVTLHPVGLGEENADLPFFLTEHPNMGLGTFSKTEQYDVPLQFSSICKVVRGDEYLRDRGITEIDAIKIDVQGFEAEVLHGLKDILHKSKPFLWIELGEGTRQKISSIDHLGKLLPYPFSLYRFTSTGPVVHSQKLVPTFSDLPIGDYLIAPS